MPRPSIQIFAEAMEKKLQRDDNTKPPWEHTDLTDLFRRLLDEVEELADAECPENKQLECCDVALFAMMIYSQIHPYTKDNLRGREPMESNDIEKMKAYEALERERWEETALICPARKWDECCATQIPRRCSYLTCWGRFVALQFCRKV
jgi:hypothetical protein